MEAIDLEEQDIAVRHRAIQQGLRVWASEVEARAGAIVTIFREGDPEIVRGLAREADRKVLRATRHRNEKAPPFLAVATGSDRVSVDTTAAGGDDA